MRSLLTTAVIWMAAAEAFATAPNVLTYQGRLLESGAPVSGSRQVTVRLCDALTGGTCYDTGTQGAAVQNGVFRTTFTLATTPPLPAAGLAGGTWFVELAIAGTTLSPREQFTSSPYAVFASSAETLSPPTSTSPGVTISTNVGVGTAPSAPLHVLSSAAGRPQVLVESGGAISAELRVRGGPAGSEAVAALDRPDNAGSAYVDLRSAGVSRWQLRLEPAASQSRFDLNETVNGVQLPHLTVQRGGRAGVGIVSPSAQLHVSSASATSADALLKVSSGAATGQEIVTVLGDGLLSVGATQPLQVGGTGPRFEVNGPANVVGQLSINGGSGFPAAVTVNGTVSASGALNLVGPGSSLTNTGNGGINAGSGGLTTSGDVTVTGGGRFSGSAAGLDGALRLVSSATLSGASSAMTLGLTENKRYLRVIIRVVGVTSAAILHLRFNSDSGANYSVRRVQNGATTTATSATELGVFDGAYSGSAAEIVLDVPNNGSAIKAGMLSATDYVGATAAPSHVDSRWVWGDIGTPIGSITLSATAGSLLSGTSISAYGTD